MAETGAQHAGAASGRVGSGRVHRAGIPGFGV